MTESKQLDAAIRAHAQDAATSHSDRGARDAAQRTGGVPVYMDMSGVLTVGPDGRVHRYDPETGTVEVVQHEGWRVLALSRAGRQFADLAALEPIRPRDAKDCEACHGAGVAIGNVVCGPCFGTGWSRL